MIFIGKKQRQAQQKNIVAVTDTAIKYKLYITVQRTEYHGTNQLAAVMYNITTMI